MLEWIRGLMESAGYAGIAFLMFLENVFPPIPSEVIMPLAGFTAARGDLGFLGVVIAGTLGSVLGALPLYYIGRLVGRERLSRWADEHGKWLALSGRDVDKASEWYERHGSKTVLFGRLVPGVRSLVSIPAGVAGMNLPKFLGYTAVGAGLWSALLAYLGQLLGQNYEAVERYLGPVAFVVIGGLVVFGIVAVVRRRRAAG